MSSDERRPAVQGRKDLEASRLAYALEHMPDNKAYRYAAEQAGGDADGQHLDAFRDRFTRYRQGWRGNARFAVDNGLHDEYYARTGWGPLSLDIEVAAVCDLACPFCYRQAIATPDKTMTEELFYRVMDQGATLGVPSVKFNWRGEPLLHPALPAFVDYAKQKGVLETIINTDAVTLTAEKSEALIDAGLDLIVYSFDGGTKATYEKMRPGRFKTNHFEDVYANIRRFAEIRARKSARFPRTKIQMVLTADTFGEQEQFFDVFRSFAIDAVFVFMEKHHACFCCAGHQHLHAPEGLIPPTVHAFGCWRIKAKYADVFCAKNAAQFDRALESLQVRFKWIIRGDLANGGTNGTQSHPTRLQKTEERIDLLRGQIQHIRFMDRPQFNISDPASRQHVELLDGIGRDFIGESTDGETCHDCILRVGLAVC